MRKNTLLVASLFLAVGAMAQVNYTPNATGAKTRTNRMVGSITVNGDTYTMPEHNSTTPRQSYTDLTATKMFTVDPGSIVSLEMTANSSWMNAFVYVDADNNGFTAGIQNNYQPTGDLVSYSFYNNGAASDENGWNSNGTEITGDNRSTLALPNFTAPATEGTYRIRFKYDWCNIDPAGSTEIYFSNNFTGHGGEIIDALLVVKNIQTYTVTYNYKENGRLVGSIAHTVAEGSAFPAVGSFFGVTIEGSAPSGTVSEDCEHDIAVRVNMPFEYAASYDEIDNKWYNLVMHSTNATGEGTDKYRTYLGGETTTIDNQETLKWGTNKSLTNPTDDYFWAFVGDPFNGFRVVNKATGEGKILSSNGTTNPLLLTEESLAEGYNTTWKLAARKYDDGTSSDTDVISEGAWFCLNHTIATNKYINANGSSGKVAFWTDRDNGSAFLAMKPVSIKAIADMATYYTENTVVKPEGATVYYATEIVGNGKYIHMEEIEGDVIPKQTGVIIQYTTNADVVYAPELSTTAATAIEGNMLKGSIKNTTIEKAANTNYYVLGIVDNEVGMYNPVHGGNKTYFVNGAYKAYLEVAGSAGSASFFGFDFEGTTGIENVEVAKTANAIYDLTGRRVEAITEAGIYIVNGKKILVK